MTQIFYYPNLSHTHIVKEVKKGLWLLAESRRMRMRARQGRGWVGENSPK